MIYFKYLRWKNFLSTGNVFTEIKLDKHKTSLIIGENGAGKSTILDALSFSLYGKPFRKINKKQLVNSINGKEAEVQVEFSISKDNYKIVRHINKYGTSKFEVYKDDELINQDAAAKDYQEMLEKNILKLNHKSFSQIVVLGSSTFVPFMQLPSQHRREVIEDLLDIQIFSTMNTILKEKVSENKNALVEVDYKINLAEQKIEMQEQHISQLKDNTQKRINENKVKIAKAESEKKVHVDNITQLQEQVDEIQEQKHDIEAVKKKKKKLEQFEYKLQDKISKLEQEIEFYSNHDDCPTCKQNIDENFKCDIVDKKQTNLEETNSGFTLLQEEYTKINEQLEQIQAVQEKVSELQQDISSNNSQINALNKLIDSINGDIESINTEQDSDDTNKDKLEELQIELANTHTEKESLTEEKGVLDVASLILKDSGIKTRIIRQYVPVMNKLISKYLAAMDFFVQFELDESFNETIKSRFRDEFSYESFSEGEKMRIDLALLFTWRAIAKLRNSVSTNLLIMDEVFDSSLDSTGTDEFMKILNDLTSDANVFIISHKGDQLMDKFQNTVRFEKVKNFSRIAA
jgi:DNA repair exonuclease SbcCD ATPase subunit